MIVRTIPHYEVRHVVYDTADDVRIMRTGTIREALGWLDNYLGKVQ
jgi:hypothetical protein